MSKCNQKMRIKEENHFSSSLPLPLSVHLYFRGWIQGAGL